MILLNLFFFFFQMSRDDEEAKRITKETRQINPNLRSSIVGVEEDSFNRFMCPSR